MPKALSYAEALRILGKGPGSEWTRRLNDLTGGLLLGATVTTPAVLGWFDAHAVFARLSQQLAGTVGQRLTGAHRLDRTDRVAAAHTVIVIAAWFGAFDGADLPFDPAGAELTTADQIRLAGAAGTEAATVRAGELAGTLLQAGVHLPEPHGSREDHRARLRGTYQRLSTTAGAFLRGLALWDGLSPGEESRADHQLAALPDRALDRYDRMLLDLRADCPEADLWVREWDTTAMLESLRDMHGLMRRLAGPLVPDGIPSLLARAYAGLLDRPVAGTAERPADLDMPSLREAYLPSLFRVTEAEPDRPPDEEGFWAGEPVRGDLHDYLAGYLTSPRAQHAPLVVLGQPGAGKSVLTKVLAAELAEGGFVPVRVPLRDVDTSTGLQRQIELAVRDATGEEVPWPRLAEAAAGRLPVVLLDGFDELLQATAINQSDYLHRLAEFQQRERDLGRAVAVVVTTRSSVADRASPPPGTLLLRLEPFDARRVRAWLATWHATNEALLAERGLRTLPAEVALRFPDLAGQPLLLLLLALYDADANALQDTAELSSSDLYERLLTSFARREVRKSGAHLSAGQCEAAVELELRRLSIVAFAMLNRSAQWVTERELERDLVAVFGEPPGGVSAGGIDTAGLLLGRFFFVHRTQAIAGATTFATYEFLHATFGEYLIARLTWQLFEEAVSRRSVSVLPAWAGDDGLPARLLSFVPLAVRSPILRFLAESASALSETQRAEWTAVIAEMYRRSQYLSWGLQSGDYRPATVRMPVRYAAYSANLVLLAVLVAGGTLRYSVLAEPDGLLSHHWHDQSLLWHAQLGRGDGANALTLVLAADQVFGPDGERDVDLRFVADGTAMSRSDVLWLFSNDSVPLNEQYLTASSSPEKLERYARFHGCARAEFLWRMAQPILESPLAPAAHMFAVQSAGVSASALQLLLRVWLLPVSEIDPAGRTAAYTACASVTHEDFPSWDTKARTAYVTLLLNAAWADPDLPEGFAEELERRLSGD
ncbi:NACHT domain-containing protein [Actinoplanes utahensis]|uniref:NACHT domain-containing protein n=1 Tax=Actinoplanes utahensis TaxID=1869 RepID=UPI00068CF4E8|nr:hypothetical protein [Actinoplanes utahensis]